MTKKGKDDAKWPEDHQNFRIKHGLLAENDEVWSASHLLKGVPRGAAGTTRECDVVDIAWQHALKCHPDLTPTEVSEGLIVDISQSVNRVPWCLNKVRSLTGSSKLYSFARDEVLNPQQHLSLLGFPPCDLSNLSKTAVYDLASEAMAMPNVTAVAICLAHTLQT